MTKLELISTIAKKTGITNGDTSAVLECFFDTVINSMSKGNNISIRGFGSFVNKKRAKKLARNIKTNTAIMLDECYVPSFKPASAFVNLIKEKVKP